MAGALAPQTWAGARSACREVSSETPVPGREAGKPLDLLLGPGCIRVPVQPPVPAWLARGWRAPPFAVSFGPASGCLLAHRLSPRTEALGVRASSRASLILQESE